MPTTVLDIEQHLLLLELEAPFDKRDVQLARRRMAKRWHPDVAPPGRQFEHERHLKAINEAADQLERLAEGSRGGRVSRNAVASAPRRRAREREEAGRRAYEAEQRARAHAKDRAEARPVRQPRARPLGRAPLRALPRPTPSGAWAPSPASTSPPSPRQDGEEVQQWARVKFSHGIRTVPAGQHALRRLLQARPRPRSASSAS